MKRPFKLRTHLTFHQRDDLRYMDLDTKGYHVITVLTKEEWDSLSPPPQAKSGEHGGGDHTDHNF